MGYYYGNEELVLLTMSLLCEPHQQQMPPDYPGILENAAFLSNGGSLKETQDLCTQVGLSHHVYSPEILIGGYYLHTAPTVHIA